MEMKFYRCAVCGQIVGIVKETNAPLVCCGKPMEELIPCSTDGAHEKHVPVIKCGDNRADVMIGSAPHPMEQEHYIEWISLETKCGNQRKELKPGDEPKACFSLCSGDKVIAAFAYCNQHGLWKATAEQCGDEKDPASCLRKKHSNEK